MPLWLPTLLVIVLTALALTAAASPPAAPNGRRSYGNISEAVRWPPSNCFVHPGRHRGVSIRQSAGEHPEGRKLGGARTSGNQNIRRRPRAGDKCLRERGQQFRYGQDTVGRICEIQYSVPEPGNPERGHPRRRHRRTLRWDPSIAAT